MASEPLATSTPDPIATSRPAFPAPPLVRCGAEMAGVGTALPATVVPNATIAERLGIDAEWILKRTGIEERRSAQPGERLFEFAAAAGAEALAEAGVAAAEVDLIVLATTSNEELMPAAAPRVAALLGATEAACYDVSAACTGFLSAVSVACGQIESGRAVNVLVIGADLMMPLTDPDDRATAAVFADGAGAVLMRGTLEGRVGPIVLRSDGTRADLIKIDRSDLVIRMQGHETFRYAVDLMSSSTVEAVELAGMEMDEVDLFVYHQANSRILRAVGERLGLAPGRVIDSIAKLGNTSAATIPLALAQAKRSGQLRQGARVLLGAFGAGLSWGATVVEWRGAVSVGA
ncbi:MAG TPA: beta-ketoacyl-ACP synthase 3 [Solirubrobacterales bacterium]|nr:beta-ketoacyl-ACP synthase 3 [Solirubrobacterales bacterium]